LYLHSLLSLFSFAYQVYGLVEAHQARIKPAYYLSQSIGCSDTEHASVQMVRASLLYSRVTEGPRSKQRRAVGRGSVGGIDGIAMVAEESPGVIVRTSESRE